MSSTCTQRVENLKKDFMKYHKEGYSIVEIAGIFQVDFSTVYHNLQEIADANGLSRESLLKRPTSGYSSRLSFSKEKTNALELKESFSKLEEDITVVIANIEKILTSTKE